jgi:hypothetical protein
MRTVTSNGREWIVRDVDFRFTIKETDGLWKAEDENGAWVGGEPMSLHDQLGAVTKWWNTTTKGRGLLDHALGVLAEKPEATKPFLSYLAWLRQSKCWADPATRDALVVYDVSSREVRCVPENAIACYLDQVGELWQAVDVVTGKSVSGTPGSRETGIERGLLWLDERAKGECRVVLDGYYSAWLQCREKPEVCDALDRAYAVWLDGQDNG